MSVAHEVYPRDVDYDSMRGDPAETAASPPELSILEKALLEPVAVSDPITSEELQAIRREDADDASVHYLTTLFLRLAGNKTKLTDYQAYRTASNYNTRMQTRAGVSKETRAASREGLAEAQQEAAPYIEVFETVSEVARKYREAYNTPNLDDRREFVNDIYDQSENLDHRGLAYITAHRHDLRETVIISERLFRIMLIDAKSTSRQPQT